MCKDLYATMCYHVIPGTGDEERKMDETCTKEEWEFDGRGLDYRAVCTKSRDHTGDHYFELNGQFIPHQKQTPKMSVSETEQYRGRW